MAKIISTFPNYLSIKYVLEYMCSLLMFHFLQEADSSIFRILCNATCIWNTKIIVHFSNCKTNIRDIVSNSVYELYLKADLKTKGSKCMFWMRKIFLFSQSFSMRNYNNSFN